MIDFYYNLSPNPTKIALALEEMGLAYTPHPVDTRKGEQFAADYVAINPNGKVPAIVDDGVVVFDSNAILAYLSEKTGQFGPPAGAKGRADFLSWLMFVATGVGPFSGQCVHFRHFAPEDVPYAKARYTYEVERHFGILDARLADRPYLLGADYTVVDMSLWSWSRMVPFILGEGGLDRFSNVKRHHDAVGARPAVARALALKDRHSFKPEMDDEARRHMFKFLKAA
ncbi:MAG: glutathione S-transferase family protein [Methylobacteriaceae bacterium]|nr:glutathione S-transferase family protein [Methylobacteriaceae bacterium]